ncbi:MAG: hypothetical protein MUF52_03210 [Syntrophobacteraceae bacterium]|jgi:hypothetical protein|nr:hypothetical protein [Syntrophobacteraceae bacterium]
MQSEKVKNIRVDEEAKVTDLLINSLAEVLSVGRPIERPEEAYNCASTLSDMLHFLSRVAAEMDLGKKDRNAVSEIIGALVVVSHRIMDWEKKALGIEDLTMTEIKYLHCGGGTKE